MQMVDPLVSERWRRIEGNRMIFALIVVLVSTVVFLLAFWVWQTERRTDALDELAAATARIEEAAVHTEQVLVEVVEARDTPEAVAQNQRVREALAEIGQIKRILCDTVEHPECQEEP